jgi:uncharacterized tellurite resistance protein B-like protein
VIDSIKRLFLKSKNRNSGHERGAAEKISVAVCALFLEMSRVDGEFAEAERRNILRLLQEHCDIPETEVEALMEASESALADSIDLWQFTNLINQNYSRQEKVKVIEMVWQVLYADGSVDKHEDYLVRKLAKLLRLTHKELIDAKRRAAQSPPT